MSSWQRLPVRLVSRETKTLDGLFISKYNDVIIMTHNAAVVGHLKNASIICVYIPDTTI